MKSDRETLWKNNLRRLMSEGGWNPRRLSLDSGLNPTAVRDLLEGRAKFPRYDTVAALAKTLGVSTSRLMDTEEMPDDALALAIEITLRLSDAASSIGDRITQDDLRRMASTVFRSLWPKTTDTTAIDLQISRIVQQEKTARALSPQSCDFDAQETEAPPQRLRKMW